ncbi:MAG TPA: hypothetical protein VFB80_15685 [Pirellulaceae bacterium]|nr:hypothetical protein [Pirellulaceae bacterium]
MKFSLLTLLVITAFAGLACAALVKPSVDWLTAVVSLTALAFIYQVLRALVQRGASQAAAAGWLLFASTYLLLVFCPWLGERVGPDLITSRAILAAQQRWLPESNSVELQLAFVPDGGLVASVGWPLQTTVNVNSNASYALVRSLLTAPNRLPHALTPAELFCRTAHWLCAWLAGGLGAAVALVCYRRRHGAPRGAASLPAR